MADELDKLIAGVREKVEQGEGRSLVDILRELGISPENYRHVKDMLSGLGYSDSELSDSGQMAKIAERFLSSMPPETCRQLTGMVLQVVTDMNGGVLPPEVAGFLSTLVNESTAASGHGD